MFVFILYIYDITTSLLLLSFSKKHVFIFPEEDLKIVLFMICFLFSFRLTFLWVKTIYVYSPTISYYIKACIHLFRGRFKNCIIYDLFFFPSFRLTFLWTKSIYVYFPTISYYILAEDYYFIEINYLPLG